MLFAELALLLAGVVILVILCALLAFVIARAGSSKLPARSASDGDPSLALRAGTDLSRPTTRSGVGTGWWLVGCLAAGVLLLLVTVGAGVLWVVFGVLSRRPTAGAGGGAGQPLAVEEQPADPAAGALLPAVDDPELAKLDAPARPPFAVDPALQAAGAVIYLRDMQAFDPLPENDPWGVGGSFEGRISPHGLPLDPGFGQSVARRRYALGKQAQVFKAGVAFTDDPNGYRRTISPATFVVLGDGKELWKSKGIDQNGRSEECVVDVANVEVLELRVRCGGLRFAAPLWIEPRLFKDRGSAAAEPPAGEGSAGKELDVRAESPRLSLKEAPRRVDDLTVTPLRLEVQGLLPCLCWSNDGGSFFYLEGSHGVLGRVSLDGLEEVRRLHIGARCSWLSVSAEGLLVTVAERSQVWLIDPERLSLKARLDVPGVQRAVSAPGLHAAFARGTPFGFPGGARLYRLDLKARTVEPAAIEGLPKKALPEKVLPAWGGKPMTVYPSEKSLPAWGGVRLTDDGKYLFTHHAELHRFRIDGRRLVYEETGPNLVGGGRLCDLVLSPDGRFVCLPAGGGNDISGPFPGRPKLRPYSLYVYSVKDLKRPVIPLEIGAYPTVIGFDPADHLIYAKAHNFQLILFSETGERKKQYAIRTSNSSEDVKQFLAHPRGGELLLLADRLYRVERRGP